MPSFPLSLRLLATPLWALARGRELLATRSRPLLELHLGARHGLPDARTLLAVADAEDVRGIHVTVDALAEGWATLAAAREALQAVRRAGKFVSFELERCGNGELYLASVADRVWLRPMAQVQALGVAATLRFAGDALERLGISFDLESAGEYKSFGETFTRAWASPENREAIVELVDGLEKELEEGIAAGRKIPVEQARAAIHDGPLDAEEAVRRGLVDGVLYADGVRKELDRVFGEEDTPRLAFARWARIHGMRVRLERWAEARRRIAVVHLAGNVVDGEGAPGAPVIASRPTVGRLEDLADDDSIAAVVLDIRSPGGSATASDVIWRAASELGRKKPLVAVLGDVAASGGYYIAVAASEILVAPNTLTGSIGVVGGKPVIGGALARVGVHTELVLGAPHAGTYSADVRMSETERGRFRASLKSFYAAFVDRVARGRKRTVESVEPVARGRVWTGRRAVELGLADRLGSVHDGVQRAAQLAGVTSPAVVDIRVAPPTARWVRLARALVEDAVPEVRLLPSLPPAARALMEAPGQALLLWPWDLDTR